MHLVEIVTSCFVTLAGRGRQFDKGRIKRREADERIAPFDETPNSLAWIGTRIYRRAFRSVRLSDASERSISVAAGS